MANKNRKKRKNSSEGDSVKTSKQNKEAKTGFNIVTPEGIGETLANSIRLQYSPVLPVDMNNSVFGATASTPIYPQVHGHLNYPMSSGVGLTSPPGVYSGIPPTAAIPGYTLTNLVPPATQSSPQAQNMQQTVQQTVQPHSVGPTATNGVSGVPGVNTELMRFLNTKFEEVNKKLEKLDLLEKRINDVDSKVSRLWSDLDERVKVNAENVARVENRGEQSDFELAKAQEELATLKEQNQTLKDSINDIQSKSMINNLIIGGVDEVNFETEEGTKQQVGAFLRDDLQIPQDRLTNIKFERVQRIGARVQNRPRKILTVFADNRDKNFVKSFRGNLENSPKFMHDQYPAQIVAYRKKLVPFLKRAKDDGEEAYIKYNKLIIDGAVYTDGAYGPVPK